MGSEIVLHLRNCPSTQISGMMPDFAETLLIRFSSNEHTAFFRAVVRKTYLVLKRETVQQNLDAPVADICEMLATEAWNDQNVPLWRVGNLCTVLQVSEDTKWLCVLVHRH